MRLRNIPEAKTIVAQSPYVITDPYVRRGNWKSFSGKPLYLEIGMGKGRFIIETAKRYPDREFIGVEMYESVLYKACEKMAGKPDLTPASLAIAKEEKAAGKPDLTPASLAIVKEEKAAGKPDLILASLAIAKEEKATGGSEIQCTSADAGGLFMNTGDESFVPPANLHFLRMDARALPEVFAPEEVDGIYLNFSDPWPKVRHAKRRLTSGVFLEHYSKFLKNGGLVEFKTDNRPLFDFSVEEFTQNRNWEILQLTYDLHADPVMGKDNVMTEYEKKFSALGNKINKLIAVYHKDA